MYSKPLLLLLLFFRPAERGAISPSGIADERGFYVHATGVRNPVLDSDFGTTDWVRDGLALRLQAQSASTHGQALLVLDSPAEYQPPVEDTRPSVSLPGAAYIVAARSNVGLLAYSAGPEVYVLDRHGLPDPVASDPGGTRPVLIVQANAFNRSRISTVLAVIITTNERLSDSPGNVRISPRETGLREPSVANISQIITADRTFLRQRIGRVRAETMARVESGLRLILDL